jgi:hypothetical protein
MWFYYTGPYDYFLMQRLNFEKKLPIFFLEESLFKTGTQWKIEEMSCGIGWSLFMIDSISPFLPARPSPRKPYNR